MTRHIKSTVLFEDVHSALRQYHATAALEHHHAQRWPAVIEDCSSGTPISTAIQRRLDQALATLETRDKRARDLLHEQFVYAAAASERGITSQIDHPTHAAIQALAAILTQLNRDSRSRQKPRFKHCQPIVGLDQHVAQVVDQLFDPAAPPIVIIEGMEGRGKTTLARMVAARCDDDERFDGVLWASARHTQGASWAGQPRRAPVAVLNPDDLLLKLADELGIAMPGDLEMMRAEVHAHCALKRYLIVFDNLETAADVAALTPLIELVAGPSRLVIATRDHVDSALPPTLRCTCVRLEELVLPTTCQLLRSAADTTDAGSLAQASDAEMAQIYAAVGGNPLALWLVVGQTQHQPWQCLLHDLSEQRSLGREPYDYLYRRAWQDLTDEARTLLFAMHRCENGAEHDLLFELSMLDQSAFEAARDELQRRMLLCFDGRYTIHRLTYTFLRVVIAGW